MWVGIGLSDAATPYPYPLTLTHPYPSVSPTPCHLICRPKVQHLQYGVEVDLLIDRVKLRGAPQAGNSRGTKGRGRDVGYGREGYHRFGGLLVVDMVAIGARAMQSVCAVVAVGGWWAARGMGHSNRESTQYACAVCREAVKGSQCISAAPAMPVTPKTVNGGGGGGGGSDGSRMGGVGQQAPPACRPTP